MKRFERDQIWLIRFVALNVVALVNCGFHLASEFLSQFVFSWSILTIDYLAFWQIVVFGYCKK